MSDQILRDEDWVKFSAEGSGGFRRDTLYRNIFGFQGTRKWLEGLARDYGGELLSSHIDRYTFDIVGIALPSGLEFYRTLGIRLRFFDRHTDRIADLQRRIDLLRDRAARRRSV